MKRQSRSNTQHHRQSSVRSRPLLVENLERRLMLAADVAAFQNPLDANDINNDYYVTPRDALIMINLINEPDSRGDRVGGFIDPTGDKLFTNHDALYVINTLNAPDTLPTGITDRFDKLVLTLDSVPTTLDGDLKELADKLVATQNEMDQAYDILRAELDEFLEFSIDQQVALETRFQDLEEQVDFSFKVMEREIQETTDEFLSLDPAIFENQDFDRLDPPPTEETSDPASTAEIADLNFLTEDFNWDEVDNLGDGLEALFTDLQDVVTDTENWAHDNTNAEDLLTLDEQGWLSDFDTGDATLADFMAGQMETAAAADWLLLGGDDVAALVDAIQADLINNGTDFVEFVDEYFTDEAGFLGLVDDLMDGCVNGEMHHGDQMAVGGETTGSIIQIDETTSFELDFHNDPELLAVAEALHEQPVMVFGTLYKIEGVEIPERTIMDVQMIVPQEKITDLATTFAQLDLPLGDSLIGKFEEIYMDNVDHYADLIADLPVSTGITASTSYDMYVRT